jgi:site-specific recombinase XerC
MVRGVARTVADPRDLTDSVDRLAIAVVATERAQVDHRAAAAGRPAIDKRMSGIIARQVAEILDLAAVIDGEAVASRSAKAAKIGQLRHTVATKIRRKYGLEAAQVVLGHSMANVTQIYAERDLAKAAAVIREVG